MCNRDYTEAIKKSKHINCRQFECNTAQEITGNGMQTAHIFAGYVI